MSRKTKKQKLAAEQHRAHQVVYSVSEKSSRPVSDLSPIEPESRMIFKHSPILPENMAKPILSTDYSYVLSDLKRILSLTVLAICAQLVLWYFLGRS